MFIVSPPLYLSIWFISGKYDCICLCPLSIVWYIPVKLLCLETIPPFYPGWMWYVGELHEVKENIENQFGKYLDLSYWVLVSIIWSCIFLSNWLHLLSNWLHLMWNFLHLLSNLLHSQCCSIACCCIKALFDGHAVSCYKEIINSKIFGKLVYFLGTNGIYITFFWSCRD